MAVFQNPDTVASCHLLMKMFPFTSPKLTGKKSKWRLIKKFFKKMLDFIRKGRLLWLKLKNRKKILSAAVVVLFFFWWMSTCYWKFILYIHTWIFFRSIWKNNKSWDTAIWDYYFHDDMHRFLTEKPVHIVKSR